MLYNTPCGETNKPIAEIETDIKDETSLVDVRFFEDNVYTIPFTGTSITTTRTLYAQVRDSAGKVKFVYTIQVNFKPIYDFTNLLNQIAGNLTQSTCGSTFNLGNQQHILQKVLGISDYANYTIVSASYNAGGGDIPYDFTTPIPNPSTVRLTVRYVGSASCPGPVDEVILINFINTNPVISSGQSLNKCDLTTIAYSEIINALGFDPNRYTLETSALSDGSLLNFGTTTQLVIQVRVKEKGTSCVSNEEDFIIYKVPPVAIQPLVNLETCLIDFTQTHIDNAVANLKNGTTATLSFFNGTQVIAESDLLNYMKTNINGVIQVTAQQSGFCDTQGAIQFKLNTSSIALNNNIAPLRNPSCLTENQSYLFTQTAIETYLKGVLANNTLTFSGISTETLPANGKKEIRFQAKKSGETCWSEFMTVELQVINTPNVIDLIDNYMVDCDRKFTINAQVLKASYGNNVFIDYDVFINGQKFDQSISLTMTLDFTTGDPVEIPVEIRNKLVSTCNKIVYLEVYNKANINVDTTLLNVELANNKIVFCDTDTASAESQLNGRLQAIYTRYPTIQSMLTNGEILDQFKNANGIVEVEFFDPAACGSVLLKIHYVKNPLPKINLAAVHYVCNEENYLLDLSAYTNYRFKVINTHTNQVVLGISSYQLTVGDYRIEMEDKTTGCSVSQMIKVTYADVPTIEKVTITENTIEIISKSKGKLEYSIDGGRTWHPSGVFKHVMKGQRIIPAVRLNGCGVLKLNEIVYLNFPNFISPNGDGKNDQWKPIGLTDSVNSYHMLIFDRTGKKMAEAEGANVLFWDGKLNGNNLPSTTYWYLVKLIDDNKQVEVQYSGSILLKNAN